MAFKKTGGRSALVQPTGLPNFSGFKQAAASYNQLGEMAYGIGLDDRKREFNQLIRQAEIDGKTAGVTYDADGNLIPLTNFDYAKASETFADADKKQILDAYRKAAVQTYVNAASNDIDTAAEQSLLDNPNDPAAIRSSAQGYLQGIEDLDPEIYTALAPKVASAFQRVENRALGKQRQESIEFAIDQAVQAYGRNIEEIATLAVKGEGIDDPERLEGLKQRESELLAENEEIMKTLELNEFTEVQMDQLKDAAATVVASRVAQASIERSFAVDGASKTLIMINQAYKEALTNEDLDAEALKTAMISSYRMMENVAQATDKEEAEARSSIFGALRLQVVRDGLDIRAELQNPSSPIHSLESTSIASLMSESDGRKISTKNAADAKLERLWAINKTKYENELKVLKSPEIYAEEVRLQEMQRAMKEIERLTQFGVGPEGPGLLIDAKVEYRKAFQTITQKSRDDYGASVHTELGPRSSFAFAPAHWGSPKVIADLEQQGVIGSGGYWSSRKAYLNDVDSYKSIYTKNRQNNTNARKGYLKIRNGMQPNETELRAISMVSNFGKVQVNGELVDVDLYSESEDVFEASANAVAGFAIENGGNLHPDAVMFFKTSQYNVANADRALRVMAQVTSAIRADKDIDQDHVEGIFFNNLDEETVAFLRAAGKYQPELAVEMFSPKNKMSQNRVGAMLAANGKYTDMPEAEATQKLFDDAFREAVQTRSFFKYVTFQNPLITDADDQMFLQMANEGGFSSVEDMVVNDPIIRDGMFRLFMGKMLNAPPGTYTPAEAMRDTFRDIGKRFGPQYNSATDKLEFVMEPIIKHAQATVNAAGITLDMNDINRDIKDKFLTKVIEIKDPATGTSRFERISANPHNLPDTVIEQLEAINVEGIIFPSDRIVDGPSLIYVANEVFGGEQTYTVLLRESSGKVKELLPNYRYDFAQTASYESFQRAVNQLKSDRMKQFWSAYGLMDQNLVQSTFDSLERARDDRTLNGLIKAYNFMFGSHGSHLRGKLEQEPFNKLNEDEVDEFYYMLDRITTLGWR